MTADSWPQPGDRALVRTGTGWAIVTVERLTATQIVTENDTRYRRDTLRRVGGSQWDSSQLQPAEGESLREYRIWLAQRRIGRAVREIEDAAATLGSADPAVGEQAAAVIAARLARIAELRAAIAELRASAESR